ncbi:MAG: DUF1844 domain-containing protein [Phycisphaerae bacterium]|nr:DUF1844 domain-containing protein [Phycisphaerae bacterium]
MTPPLLGPDGNPLPVPNPATNPDAARGPSLHVDSDWKAQAQAEKERLAKLEEERAKSEPGRGPGGAQGPNGEEFPPADFRSLVGVLASQAMMGLGAYGDEQGRMIVDLPGAQFAIDLLAVLEEKTKGNLSADESTHLTMLVGELRSRYVQLMTIVAQQMQAKAGGAAALRGPGAPPPFPR